LKKAFKTKYLRLKMPGAVRKFAKTFIITCNIIAGTCMLLLYLLPHMNQRNGWFINLFALALPFLLLVQAGFFIFWALAKRKLAVIPLLFCIVSWGLITNFFSFRFASSKKQTQTNTLRIATWNVHLYNFFENKGLLDKAMLEKTRQLKADILALQEFVFSLDSSSPVSLERIKKSLGYKYAVTANDRAFGVHTNIKQRNEKYHPFCVALFSNYPVLRWQKVQSLKEYNHTFLWADILVHTDTIRVFNIHLQSMHFAKDDYTFIENINQNDMDEVQRKSRSIIRKMKSAYLLRASQAADVKAEIDKSPYPVVVCGDMNDVPNSYAYQVIGKKLKDAQAEKGAGIGKTFKFLSPTLRIDYIFYSKTLQLERTWVIRPSMSDHYPVAAEFSRK
jgi:endonuclease/exonuclease/phosphatase family metal-dependent hydrolase